MECASPDPISVLGDAASLRRLMWIMLDNAIKYTNSPGSIKVKLEERSEDAILEVNDTGIGIAEADLPHIFERFYVVDRSRTRGSGGAGLGLAIVKGIVDAHGGAISAESMLGRGTAFTIRLPIMRIKRDPS